MIPFDGLGATIAMLAGAHAPVLAAIAPAPPDTDLVDTLTGLLMLSVAIGIIATLLIAVSRRATLYVSVEQALVAPVVICSVGAAVLHLWVAPDLFVAWAPAGLVSFLLAAFQAEWAFAFTRPALRPTVLVAGLVLNSLAALASLWVHGLGPALGPTAGVLDIVSGADLAGVAFEVAIVAMLVFAVWPGTRGSLRTRRIPATTAIELRSFAASAVGLLTFLAMAGLGHSHA